LTKDEQDSAILKKMPAEAGKVQNSTNQSLVGVGRPELMTGWFARTATLLLLAFPIFLSSLPLLLLIAILLMAATLLLLSAFQFFLFLPVHSKPPLAFLLKNKRILGL
jgi:hypothetical protein